MFRQVQITLAALGQIRKSRFLIEGVGAAGANCNQIQPNGARPKLDSSSQIVPTPAHWSQSAPAGASN